jgi:hypothetical protein
MGGPGASDDQKRQRTRVPRPATVGQVSKSLQAGAPNASGRVLPRRLTLAVLGVLLGLLLAELILRFAIPPPRLLLPLAYDTESLQLIASGEAYISYDRELGWLPTPNVSQRVGTTRYTHNRVGLRAERDYQDAPPGRRYAAFGDSFTYCQEVSIGACWTERLAGSQDGLEVVNFGVPGYAPDQAWLRYQRTGSARSCAVLIGHLAENVNRVVNRFRPFYEPSTGIPLAKPRFLLDGDDLSLLPPAAELRDLADPRWVEAHLGPHDIWYFPGTFVQHPFDVIHSVRVARSALYQSSHREGTEWTPAWATRMYRPDGEPFRVLLAVLSSFAAEVRSSGATPVVLIFPTLDEVVAARDRHPKTHQPLLDALAARGIATVDLTDALGPLARRYDTSRLFEGHYTPFANEEVAQTLARRLPTLTGATCS